MNFEQTVTQLEKLLIENLPQGCGFKVYTRNKTFGGQDITILFWATFWGINSADAQSFSLSKDWELQPQMYGGVGGRTVTREVDPNIEAEQYLALSSERIYFRKPKPNQKAVFAAIEKHIQRWQNTLADIEERGLTYIPLN